MMTNIQQKDEGFGLVVTRSFI